MKKLTYKFIPMPAVIVDEQINMSGSAMLLLMWLIRVSQRKFQMTFADDEVINGIFVKAAGKPRQRVMIGCRLSRNALKNARLELQENGFILSKRVDRTSVLYSLTVSVEQSESCQLSEDDNRDDAIYREVEKEENTTQEFRLSGEPSDSYKRKQISAEVRAYVESSYLRINGRGITWSVASAKQLFTIVTENSSWSADDWKRCVDNFYQSADCVSTQSPKFWLAKLPDYFNGPLNAFHKPLIIQQSKEDERDRDRDESSRAIIEKFTARNQTGSNIGNGVPQKALRE